MDAQILYGYSYTDETNGDLRMVVYDDIHIANSLTNTRAYPVVRHLGNVNVAQRFFLKFRKFPRKIKNIEGGTLFLNDDTQLRPIQEILLNLEYAQEFIDLIKSTVINSSNDKTVMTHEYFENYGLTYEEMPEGMALSLVGKVSF